MKGLLERKEWEEIREVINIRRKWKERKERKRTSKTGGENWMRENFNDKKRREKN